MGDSKIKKTFFSLPFFFFLIGSVSEAGSIDVDIQAAVSCDAVFCPGEGRSEFSTQLNTEFGFDLPRATRSVPSIPVGRVIIPEGGRSQIIAATADRTSSQNSNTLGAGTEDSNARGSIGDQQTGTPAQGMFGQAGGVQPHQSINGQNGLQVRNGMVYADDDEPSGIEASGAVADGQMASRLQPSETSQALSAVDLNRNQDTGREPNTGSVIAAMNGLDQPGLPKGPGRYESGGGSPSRKPAGKSLLDSLKAMAGNLGERFFGSLGSAGVLGGKGSKRGRGTGAGKKGAGLGVASTNGGAAGVNIQGIYNQYQKRGLASEMEFGSSGGWMFKNMCEHWSRLAKKERLGANQQRCPDN